jgi:hypothetical protein
MTVSVHDMQEPDTASPAKEEPTFYDSLHNSLVDTTKMKGYTAERIDEPTLLETKAYYSEQFFNEGTHVTQPQTIVGRLEILLPY